MSRRIASFAVSAAALLALSALHEPSSHATPGPAPDAGVIAGPLPMFDAEPLPADKSPTPKADEWRGAPQVALNRNFSRCRAYRMREWMKIDCTDMIPAGIAQIAGSADGVQVFIAPAPEETGDNPGRWFERRVMEVVFPLRRGEGHMFQLLEMGEGYDGPDTAVVSLTLADAWVDGESPVITLH